MNDSKSEAASAVLEFTFLNTPGAVLHSSAEWNGLIKPAFYQAT